MTSDGKRRSGLRPVAFAAGFSLLAIAVGAVLWCTRGRDEGVEELAASSRVSDRVQAIDILRKRDDAKSVEQLVRMSSDRDETVAVLAVRSLGRRQDSSVRTHLEQIFQDPAKPSRIRAAAAGELGRQKDADPSLLVRALTTEKDSQVRAGAARGLGVMRNLTTIPALAQALDDSDEKVRFWAYAALRKMMPRRFPYKPNLPPDAQRKVIEDIRAYLRECGAL